MTSLYGYGDLTRDQYEDLLRRIHKDADAAAGSGHYPAEMNEMLRQTADVFRLLWVRVVTATALVCLLLPSGAHADTKGGYAFWCSLRAADLASTEYALARGGREGNPLMRNRSVRVAVGGVASCVVLSEADKRLSKKGRKWARIIGGTVLGAVVVSNMRGGLK